MEEAGGTYGDARTHCALGQVPVGADFLALPEADATRSLINQRSHAMSHG